MSRKKIPETLKKSIKKRQENRCCCCLEKGEHYHHVFPVTLGGKNEYFNLVLLCKKHHSLTHLADIDTIFSILEYLYFLKNGKVPDNFEAMEEAKIIASKYEKLIS